MRTDALLTTVVLLGDTVEWGALTVIVQARRDRARTDGQARSS